MYMQLPSKYSTVGVVPSNCTFYILHYKHGIEYNRIMFPHYAEMCHFSSFQHHIHVLTSTHLRKFRQGQDKSIVM